MKNTPHLLSLFLLICLPIHAQEVPHTERQYSKLWGKAGELWNPEGLLKDFTNAGYRQGAEIPMRPVTTNVTDFGANGADDQDDTEAFRAAIRAVPKDGVIFIPNGTYIITDYIHVTGNAPDEKEQFPGNHFTIYNKSNFTLRGEDMFNTRIFFPKRMGEIYTRWSRPMLEKLFAENPERFNNDAFKQKFGIPLEYDFNKKGGGMDFVIDRGLQEKIIYAMDHEYAQSFTKAGSFFEFKGVTDTNVENLSFLFDDRQRFDHQENTGGNPLSWLGSENCYARNIYIRNADSGIFTRRMKNMSILSVILDQYKDRFEERYYTSGHNGIKLVGAIDCLVHNVWFTSAWWHAFDLDGANSGTVISDIKGTWLSLTYHGGFQSKNLYTGFDLDSGGMAPHKKHRLETYWGINRKRKKASYPPKEKRRRLQDVVVGVTTDDPSDVDSGVYWYETIDPEKLHPFNIYLAQMEKRGKPLPPSLSFSMGMLPLEPGEGYYLLATESAGVMKGKTKKGEDTRNINFTGKENIVRSFRDQKRYAYLKFDLSELGIDGVGKATLELFNDNMFAKGRAGETDRVTVDYMKQDDWQEEEIKYANQPMESSGSTAIPYTDLKEWSEVDVSSFARDAFENDQTLTLKVGLESNRMMKLPRKGVTSPRLIVVPGNKNIP